MMITRCGSRTCPKRRRRKGNSNFSSHQTMTKPDRKALPVKLTGRLPAGYGRLLGEIKARIRSAQYEALRAVNKELVALYWDIGRVITKRQIAGAHGDAVVKRLAFDLQQEFPAVVGFSWGNLFNMSRFYVAYCN